MGNYRQNVISTSNNSYTYPKIYILVSWSFFNLFNFCLNLFVFQCFQSLNLLPLYFLLFLFTLFHCNALLFPALILCSQGVWYDARILLDKLFIWLLESVKWVYDLSYIPSYLELYHMSNCKLKRTINQYIITFYHCNKWVSRQNKALQQS